MSQQTLRPQALREHLTAGRDRASRLGGPVLVSITQEVKAERFFAAAQNDTGRVSLTRLYQAAGTLRLPRTFWAKPVDGFFMVGAGAAAVLRAKGADRFSTVEQAHRELMESAVVEAPEAPGAGPLFMGGGRFDIEGTRSPAWKGFDDALLLLPRVTLVQTPETVWSCTNVLVAADADVDDIERSLAEEQSRWHGVVAEGHGADPSLRSGWKAGAHLPFEDSVSATGWGRQVERGLQAIQRGVVRKVVLARERMVRLDGAIDQGVVLERLIAAHANCAVFAFGAGDRSFMGATPEVLATQHEGKVNVTCLAGTIRRGKTPSEDKELAQALLERAKDRHEHAVVVEAVREALSELCARLEWDRLPTIKTLPTVHHLATSFTGLRPDGAHVLDLVDRLHPTPAVGGLPRGEALQLIREIEAMDRGWYAGPIGIVDRWGDGDFGVAIRSALVGEGEALLYAGAGIVAGSDPSQEHAETELKLKPMLTALQGSR